MILVIDTSSVRAGMAVIRPDFSIAADMNGPVKQVHLAAQYRAFQHHAPFSKIAVAVGPGSFTGTRAGASFGLGVAIGLGVPIVPLGSLAIQAARSDQPAVAVSDAGRGRVYYLTPEGSKGLAEPAEVLRGLPLVGWLRAETVDALVAAGHQMVPKVHGFAWGAARVLRTAKEVAYGSLKIDYMQSFSTRS